MSPESAGDMGRKRNASGRPGQGANPKGKPYLRGLQVILNANYISEKMGVDALDWAREHVDANGKYVTDRQIVNEALMALREKYDEGWTPMPLMTSGSGDGVSTSVVVEAVVAAIQAQFEMLLNMIAQQNAGNPYFQTEEWESRKSDFKRQVANQVSEAFSTQNLVGQSYRYNPEDEDDDWN